MQIDGWNRMNSTLLLSTKFWNKQKYIAAILRITGLFTCRNRKDGEWRRNKKSSLGFFLTFILLETNQIINQNCSVLALTKLSSKWFSEVQDRTSSQTGGREKGEEDRGQDTWVHTCSTHSHPERGWLPGHCQGTWRMAKGGQWNWGLPHSRSKLWPQHLWGKVVSVCFFFFSWKLWKALILSQCRTGTFFFKSWKGL